MARKKMTPAEAALALHDYDHAFMSAEGVRWFARSLGVKIKPYLRKANPRDPKGLSFNDGATEAMGMCAAEFAARACRELGVDYPEKYGRGSQLHACAAALEKHFGPPNGSAPVNS